MLTTARSIAFSVFALASTVPCGVATSQPAPLRASAPLAAPISLAPDRTIPAALPSARGQSSTIVQLAHFDPEIGENGALLVDRHDDAAVEFVGALCDADGVALHLAGVPGAGYTLSMSLAGASSGVVRSGALSPTGDAELLFRAPDERAAMHSAWDLALVSAAGSGSDARRAVEAAIHAPPQGTTKTPGALTAEKMDELSRSAKLIVGPCTPEVGGTGACTTSISVSKHKAKKECFVFVKICRSCPGGCPGGGNGGCMIVPVACSSTASVSAAICGKTVTAELADPDMSGPLSKPANWGAVSTRIGMDTDPCKQMKFKIQ